MTSQPDPPATDRIAMNEDAMDADQPLQSGYHAAGTSPANGTDGSTGTYGSTATDRTLESGVASDPDVIIVAGEVIEEDPDGDVLDSASLDSAGRGQQWHDIQALFVDDPHGSVELAAAAADAAVTVLVATLHQRQSALAPAASTSADPGGTEQLREALRSYRIFCQSLTEIGQRLAQSAAMAQ